MTHNPWIRALHLPSLDAEPPFAPGSIVLLTRKFIGGFKGLDPNRFATVEKIWPDPSACGGWQVQVRCSALDGPVSLIAASASLIPTTRMSFALYPADFGRLREIRRIEPHIEGHEGDVDTTLFAALRGLLETIMGLWRDEPGGSVGWAGYLRERRIQHAQDLAPRGHARPFQVRLSVPLLATMLRAADAVGLSLDGLVRLAIVNRLCVDYDFVAPKWLRRRLRLAPPPAGADMNGVEPEKVLVAAPSPPPVLVSIGVLEEVRAERGGANRRDQEPRSQAVELEKHESIQPVEAAPKKHDPLRPPSPSARPEEVLAFRPLKPPGRTA